MLLCIHFWLSYECCCGTERHFNIPSFVSMYTYVCICNPQVDILSPPAMLNLYYISHNSPDALSKRGFGWGGPKKKKKGKGGGKKKKKK